MDLDWIDDFLALADSLNFSRAAEARHVTQPAFSRRIRALEEWIGAPLFLRSTHQVSLTPAGMYFHGPALGLSRSLQQLRRETGEMAGRGTRTLSIAATHALSFTFFPRWARNNDRLFAKGTLNLISDSLQACERMMMRGDVQFLLCHTHALMSSPLAQEPFTSTVVGSDALMPLCAPDETGAALWPLQPGKPAKYLAYSAASGLGRILAADHRARPVPLQLETVFSSHLAATLLSMARAGDGMAWLPRTLAEDDLATGRLVACGPGDMIIPVDIRLFRPTARMSPEAEAIWAHYA